MKSSEICAALRDRYKQPEWCIFFEVASGTGANARRHADALAMNMYPSRGLSIIGFEVKVSRGDLKRELANPDKAEEIARYCNEWYLVVPKALIKDDDVIPVPWGIMECSDKGLRIAKKAQQLNAKPVTKEFMAAILRSAGKVDECTLREERNKAYQEYQKDYEADLQNELTRRMRAYEAIKEKVIEFEKVTGKTLDQYTHIKGLVENIRLAEDVNRLFDRYNSVQSVRRMMEQFLKESEQFCLEKEGV